MPYEQIYVKGVTGNSTAKVNEEINSDVYFGCLNGCGGFENFIQSFSGNTTTVSVMQNMRDALVQ